jgi:hypothetical protein
VVADITDATTTGDPGVPSCQASISRSVWFTFTPVATGQYRISSCADQGAGTTVDDTVIAVYTSGGACAGPFTEVPTDGPFDGCDDDSCVSENLQAVVNTELTGGTTYYLVAWKFGSSAPTVGNTAVELCVTSTTAPTAPGNDTCATATPLTTNVPLFDDNLPAAVNDYQLANAACFPALHTNSTASGRDLVYSFTAPSAANYSFRTTTYVPGQESGGLSNLVVYLAGSCPAATPGTPVTVTCTEAGNASSSSSGTLAEEITCEPLAENQQVFFFVDEHTAAAGGTFQVLAEQCGSVESEANGTPETADPFACGIQGGVNPATDADFFSLGTPSQGSRVFAAVDSSTGVASGDTDLRLNTTLDTVEWDDSNNDLLLGGGAGNIAGAVAGGSALFLQVDLFGGTPTNTSVPYRLYAVVQPSSGSAIAESEPNDSTGNPDDGLANYFSGTLAGPSPSTDVDVYRFAATEGDLIFVSLDGDPLRDATPLNARLDLFDDPFHVLSTVNDSGGSSNTTSGAGSLTATTPFSPGEAIVTRAPFTGEYYVMVQAGSTSITSAAGDYLLSISLNCQIGGGVPVELMEFTVGDS